MLFTNSQTYKLYVQNPKSDISEELKFCTSSSVERSRRKPTGSARQRKNFGTSSPNREAEASVWMQASNK